MKKLVLLALCVFAAATVFAGGKKDSGTGASADKSLEQILAKKRFIMGLDDSFPPMGFRNEKGEIVGYDVDLAREVCRRLGVELVLQPIDWNAKEQELNTGEIDCIWNGFTITDERKQALTFTPPYLKNAQVVVVRSTSAYQKLGDLAGKWVGVQAGSSAQDALDDAAAFRASLKGVIEFKENLTALMDLETGGVDAVVMDLLVANDNIHRSGKNFRILAETLAPEEYGVGFRKADAALAGKVWETLQGMAKDGTVTKFAVQWFGADISVIR
ncbi:MAG: amino acid ABC transporter substrate-binding protein [Spirochaetaceae bacterium]|nr:amino acid ABC transporter substrate-binding protein [Spirochaetaceae bacterium]